MSDDYGYFGDDSEGYAHYTDATEEKDDESGENSNPKHIGCGTVLLIAAVIITFLSAVVDGDLFK